MLGNGLSGTIFPAPEMMTRADGTYVYQYHGTPGIGVVAAPEVAVLVYATYLAHRKINGDMQLRRKLQPLLLGTLFVPTGNLLCLIPGSIFPFDMLGGVGMAVYFLAGVVASLPLVILSHNLENVLGSLERAVTQKLLIYIVLQCIWTVLVVAFARKRLENILKQKQKHIWWKESGNSRTVRHPF